MFIELSKKSSYIPTPFKVLYNYKLLISCYLHVSFENTTLVTKQLQAIHQQHHSPEIKPNQGFINTLTTFSTQRYFPSCTIMETKLDEYKHHTRIVLLKMYVFNQKISYYAQNYSNYLFLYRHKPITLFFIVETYFRRTQKDK